jgi:hypothetical protein
MKSPERNFIENTDQALDRKLADCEFLSGNDKADVLLLSQGIKKAAIISILGFIKDSAGRERVERDAAFLQGILKNAHLPYDTDRTIDGNFITASFFVGRDNIALSEFRAAREMKDGDADERRRKIIDEGRLFGYPETAIEGYLNGHMKNNVTLPEDYRTSDAMAFLNFRLSEDHWSDEWRTVEARAEQVKTMAPAVYETTIKEAQRNRKV